MNTRIINALKLSALIALIALLGACNNENGNNDDNDAAELADIKGAELAPHEVVTKGAEALRANNLQAFLQITVPAAEYQAMQAQWAARKEEPVSDADKAQYQQTMERLTQENAVDKIMTELEPQLTQMKAQMPMMIGMFSGIAQAAIAQNQQLDAEQTKQAQALLTSVSQWAMSTDFASPELAREAVEVAVDTARELDLRTMEAVRELSFNEVLAKGGLVLGGVKEMLSVYELEVNEMLESVESETVNMAGGEATVETRFTFLGTPQVVTGTMVERGGQWVAKEAVESPDELAADSESESEAEGEGEEQ